MYAFAQKIASTQKDSNRNNGRIPGNRTDLHPETHSNFTANASSAYDFSRVPVRARTAVTIQPKLSVSSPEDIYEQEADSVAQQVMRMPEPGIPRPCPCGGGCPACQAKPAGPGNERLQMKRVHASDTGQMTAPPIVNEVLSSPGQPLDPATRAFMEPRFGHDFSGVRVHSDASAQQSARDINANAYTVGQNIVFGAGKFAPETQEGRSLLAHELTHVMQQEAVPIGYAQALGARVSSGAGRTIQRQADPRRDNPKPSYTLTKIAESVIDDLDDDQSSKVLLSAILAAGRGKELPAFAAILRAKPHEKYGNYFIYLITVLEDKMGSRNTVGVLQWFADAGVDITKHLQTYSLGPLAAVAKFKSLVQKYKTLLISGRVSEADKQRVGQLIAEAEISLRGIEGDPRKPGMQVEQMGGVAVLAGGAWRLAGALAVDDLAGIGIANDVAIPFVVIGAAILSGIALFSSGPKPVILDYSRVTATIEATLLAIAESVEAAVQGPRPMPLPPPMQQERIAPVKEPRTGPQRPPPRPVTLDPVPVPTQTKPDTDKRRRKKECRKDPCPASLPIEWPERLPKPSGEDLERTKSGDPYREPAKRSGKQKTLASKIKSEHTRFQNGERDAVVPQPCSYRDKDPNELHDAHHIHPLFLGGEEDESNLCALQIDVHRLGHIQLYDQRPMLSHQPWITCKICEGNLRNHPGQQEYYIDGEK